MSCCVNNCPSKSGSDGVRLFALPSSVVHPIQRNQWIQEIQKINGESWTPTSDSAVCSKHYFSKEPHVTSEDKDMAPSLSHFEENETEIRRRRVSIEEFALEYIKHDDLLKPITGRKSNKRKQAYHLVAKHLDIGMKKVLAWEKRLRYFLKQVKRSGHLNTLTAAWIKVVEKKLLTVQASKENKQPRNRVTPGLVIVALRAGAAVRGLLCSTPLYADVRRALRLPVSFTDLHAAWVKAQQASLNALAASSRMGDRPPFASSQDTMKVADLVLMHTDVDTHRLINDESIFLYDEATALHLLVQLVHIHECEGDMPSKERAQVWTRLYKDYLQSGRVASFVALQRRWHELSLQARARLVSYWYLRRLTQTDIQATDPILSLLPLPAPIHIEIIKRYPHIVLKPFVSWRQLIASGIVIPQPLEDRAVSEPVVKVPLSPIPQANKKKSKRIHIYINDGDFFHTEDSDRSEDSENELHIDVEDSNKKHSVKNHIQNEHSEQIKMHTVSQNEEKITDPTVNALNTINPTDCETEIYFSSDSDNEIEPLVEDVKVKIEKPDICNRLVFADDDDFELNEDEDSGETGFDKKLLMDTRVNLDRMDDIFKQFRPGTSFKITEMALKTNFVKSACKNIINDSSMRCVVPKKIAKTESNVRRKSKENNVALNNGKIDKHKNTSTINFKQESTDEFKINYNSSIENLTDFKTNTLDETSGAKHSVDKNVTEESNQFGTVSDGTDDELSIDIETQNRINDWNGPDENKVGARVDITNIDEVRQINSNTVSEVINHISSMPIFKNWDNPAQNGTMVSSDLSRSCSTEDVTEIRNTEWEKQEVDFINKMPTEEHLETLLDELSFATPFQQGLYHRQCCLARRARQLNDQRAYRGETPLPLHDHKGEKCNCCCQYLCARTMKIKHDADCMELYNEIAALIKKATSVHIKKKMQNRNTKTEKAFEKTAAIGDTRSKEQASSSTNKTEGEIQPSTKDTSVANLPVDRKLKKSPASSESILKSSKSAEQQPKAVTSVEPSTLPSTSVKKPINFPNILTEPSSSVESKIKKSAAKKSSTITSKSVSPSKKASTSVNLSKKSSKSEKRCTKSSTSEIPSIYTSSVKLRRRRRKKKSQLVPTELNPTPSEDKDDNGYSEWLRQKNINANIFKIAGINLKRDNIRPSQKNNSLLKTDSNVSLAMIVTYKNEANKANLSVDRKLKESPASSKSILNSSKSVERQPKAVTSVEPSTLPYTSVKKPINFSNILTEPSTSVEPKIKKSAAEKSSTITSKPISPSKKSSTSEIPSIYTSSVKLRRRRRTKKSQLVPTELNPTSSEEKDDNGYSEWLRQKNINANIFKIAGINLKRDNIRPSQKNNSLLKTDSNVSMNVVNKNEVNKASDIFKVVKLNPTQSNVSSAEEANPRTTDNDIENPINTNTIKQIDETSNKRRKTNSVDMEISAEDRDCEVTSSIKTDPDLNSGEKYFNELSKELNSSKSARLKWMDRIKSTNDFSTFSLSPPASPYSDMDQSSHENI